MSHLANESAHALLRRFCIASLALVIALAGCRSSSRGIEVDVRDEFLTYDRVALWSSLNRETEDYFIPLYMQAFPTQTLVERRDVSAIIGEQDILPERLDEATRAKLRKILGVKAIVYPRAFKEGFAIKVIQTETGAISASVYADATDPVIATLSTNVLVRKSIDALRAKAHAHGEPRAVEDQTMTSAAAPASMQPVRPPPRD
jgi:hypothetical protein